MMRSSISLSVTGKGLNLRVSGKLIGRIAREGLELLQTVVEHGDRKITLDLRETTSLDSLGIRMFDWIRGQNGRLDVEVLAPVTGINDEELASISSAVTKMNILSNPYDNAIHRRERA
jgi:hypothetical protein